MSFRFSDFLLDSSTHTLVKNNEVVTDDQKIFLLLKLLCESYPNNVDKQTLMDELWPGQIVTDWSLSRLISDTRHVLGDSGKEQGLIQTVRGHGFRMNTEVSVVASAVNVAALHFALSSRNRKRVMFSVVFVCLGLIATAMYAYKDTSEPHIIANQNLSVRVAVLPVSGAETELMDQWIKYGIMSMMTEQLSRYQSIQSLPVANVISTMTAFETQPQEQVLFDKVCSALGCTHLIDVKYSISSGGPSLEYRVYTKHYISPRFSFKQNDIMISADTMVEHLSSQLIPGKTQRLALADTFSSDNKVNRDYAIGVHELHNGDYQSALSYLQLALKKQSDFFWARAYLAETYYRMGDLSLCHAEIENLVEGNPKLAPGERYFIEHLQSNLLYSQGKLKESMELSIDLISHPNAIDDPLLLGNELLNIGSSMQALGDLKQAETYLLRSLEKYQLANFGSGVGKAQFNLANVFLSRSENEKAIDYYQRARDVFKQFDMTGYDLMAKHQIASTSLVLGNFQYAENELRSLAVQYQKTGDLEGEYTAYVDLALSSLLKADYPQAKTRIDELLELLNSSDLSYLKNHALALGARIYLKLNQVDEAEILFLKMEHEWQDQRPEFALIEAHLLHDKGDLQGAVNKANDIKLALGEMWTPTHQHILDQLTRSVKMGEPIKLNY